MTRESPSKVALTSIAVHLVSISDDAGSNSKVDPSIPPITRPSRLPEQATSIRDSTGRAQHKSKGNNRVSSMISRRVAHLEAKGRDDTANVSEPDHKRGSYRTLLVTLQVHDIPHDGDR